MVSVYLLTGNREFVSCYISLSPILSFKTKNEAARECMYAHVNNHERTIYIYTIPRCTRKGQSTIVRKKPSKSFLLPVPYQTRHPDHGAMEDCSRRQKMIAQYICLHAKTMQIYSRCMTRQARPDEEAGNGHKADDLISIRINSHHDHQRHRPMLLKATRTWVLNVSITIIIICVCLEC